MSDNQNPQDHHVPVSPSDQSASSDANRPDSIDSADSVITSADSPQVSADSVTQPSSDQSAENLTEVSVSTQSETPAPDTNPPEPIVVPDATPQVSQISADSIPPVIPTESASPVPAEPPPSPSLPPETPTPVSEEKPSESPPQQPDINVQASDNQPSQVQSEPSDNTSAIQVENAPSQSAEIKPEPPQRPTMPSTPPENISPPAPTVSFGDLLSSENRLPSTPANPSTSSTPSIPSIPPTASPSSPVSFGDLIKDIKPEESVIPPPLVPSAPPISSTPPPISNDSQPIAPLIPPISPIAQDKLVLLRQQAKLKKAAKKQAILQKIIDLAKTHGKINNQEAQKILHLPQSTLSDYFQELVSTGIFKKEGKGKATYYHL